MQYSDRIVEVQYEYNPLDYTLVLYNRVDIVLVVMST